MVKYATFTLKADKKRGFSLLEVMISIVILSIIGITSGTFIVKTRQQSRRAEVRLQTALTANTMMQIYAVAQDDEDDFVEPSETPDGKMHFQSRIQFVGEVEDDVIMNQGGRHIFSYYKMTCETTSVEHPEVSVTLETIVKGI